MLRFLLRLKLLALVALWSLACIGLYLVVAFVEAALEVGASVGGAPIGQGAGLSGLVDLTGDIVQWGIGLLWLAGIAVLWFAKKLVTSRETRAATAGVAVKAATTAAPYVLARHPIGRAVNVARGPAGRLLGGLIARRLGKR